MDFLKDKLSKLDIDFVGMRYIAGVVSTLMVIASWVVFVGVGPNFGIDFTGGTEIHIDFKDQVSITEVRDALDKLGLSKDAVQQVGVTDDSEFTVRIQDAEFGAREIRQKVEDKLKSVYGPTWIKASDFNAEVGARLTVTYDGPQLTPQDVKKALADLDVASVSSGREENQVVITLPGLAQQITENLQGALGNREFEVLSIDAVGPKVGSELKRQGVTSVAATLGLVLLYVAFRFDVAFAPGAIIALFHDVSVTIGIFTLLQLEFNLPMIGALLTIVGYSLNDTIVIYDRIRENRDRYRREELTRLINVSINETLSRTLATSLTTMMAIVAFLVLGGPVIRNFAFAMFLGIVFGTYSTIFVASPMILVMEDIKPYLARFIALPTLPVPDVGASEGPVSATEQRRRDRLKDEEEAT
ncbi:MAG: protein translocase subunit SecF [Alphaproteobacteria bacterium]|nr:protein translocase subunit SecF [Alphaproteobacteria bacterium]